MRQRLLQALAYIGIIIIIRQFNVDGTILDGTILDGRSFEKEHERYIKKDQEAMAQSAKITLQAFESTNNKFRNGQKVILSSYNKNQIEIYKNYYVLTEKTLAHVLEENIIAHIPQNTSALVIDSYEKPLTPSALSIIMRLYLVRVTWEGKTIEGWVPGI
jgi:hypothetical protein